MPLAARRLLGNTKRVVLVAGWVSGKLDGVCMAGEGMGGTLLSVRWAWQTHPASTHTAPERLERRREFRFWLFPVVVLGRLGARLTHIAPSHPLAFLVLEALEITRVLAVALVVAGCSGIVRRPMG